MSRWASERGGSEGSGALCGGALVSRRAVVRGLVGGFVGVLAAGPAWRALGGGLLAADVLGWREILGRWWPLTEGAERDLGRRAAKMLGDAAGIGEIVRLLPRCEGVKWTAPGAEIEGGAEGALAAIDSAIAGEYAAGRVRVIDRWVLSESEAAMFALLGRAEQGR